MSTIIVHGTVPARSPHSVGWWWNSWGPEGFLGNLAEGMRRSSGSDWHDVWSVDGVDVSEVPDLQPDGFDWRDPTRMFRPGEGPPFLSYNGRFMWSGSNQHTERQRAGVALAHYLNAVYYLAPSEPLRHRPMSAGSTLQPVRAGRLGADRLGSGLSGA